MTTRLGLENLSLTLGYHGNREGCHCVTGAGLTSGQLVIQSLILRMYQQLMHHVLIINNNKCVYFHHIYVYEWLLGGEQRLSVGPPCALLPFRVSLQRLQMNTGLTSKLFT